MWIGNSPPSAILQLFLWVTLLTPGSSQPPTLFNRSTFTETSSTPNHYSVKLRKVLSKLVGAVNEVIEPLEEEGTFGVKKFLHAPLPLHHQTKEHSLEDLKLYNNFCAAVYCTKDLTYLSCPLCGILTKRLVTHKVIHNGLRQLAKTRDYQYTDMDTLALVTVHSDIQTIVVTYKGTNTFANFLLDKNIEMQRITGVEEQFKVHFGTLTATSGIYHQVRREVQDLLKRFPGYKVVVTGHSTGGAMASLTVFLFKYFKRLPPEVPIELVTYGMPRLGNMAFANYMNNLPIPMSRVVNRNDVIPHIAGYGGDPEKDAYVHHMREYWIQHSNKNNQTGTWCDDTTYEDPSCSDSIQVSELNMPNHANYFGVDYLTCFKPDWDFEEVHPKGLLHLDVPQL